MMKKDDRNVFICFPLIVLAMLLGWAAYSSFQARAFERVTGKHVSTWDAMFLDLRVQEPPK